MRLIGPRRALQSPVRVHVVCLPVALGHAWSWCAGQVDDHFLISAAELYPPRPCVILIGQVIGRAAAMRRLVHFVGDLVTVTGLEVSGFIARTDAYGAARAFERLGGVATWSEPDGRQRWFIPAEPFFAWLKATSE